MIYILVGRREMGKTTLGYRLACGKGLRSIYDPRFEFTTTIPKEFLLLQDAARAETIVQPDQDARVEFGAFCDVVKMWVQEMTPDVPRSILVDEARMVDFSAPSFDWIVRCSRRALVNVIITAHRPADVPVDVRAIADRWCVFHTTQEHDLKVLAERCGTAFATKVQTLAPFQFLVWDDARARTIEYLDPSVWFLPINPQPDVRMERA